MCREHVGHTEIKSRVKLLHKETQTGSGLKIDATDLTSEGTFHNKISAVMLKNLILFLI